MEIHVLSLFPEYFRGPLSESMLKRAQEKKILNIELIDIRDFSKERFQKVDDRPYGGGPGMVMMAEPVVSAVEHVKKPGSRVIYLSPQGARLSPSLCK